MAAQKTKDLVKQLWEEGMRTIDPTETWAQLGWLGTAVLWSWGVSRRSTIVYQGFNIALVLNVHGKIFQGQVWIMVAANDTYTVILSKNGWVQKRIEEIYVENLASVVDIEIEKVAEYVR